MSSISQQARAQALAALARELRELHGLGASLFRAAAARSGMTVTDLQVVDILESVGPATAGQLAELTGLTTGAITGMLNRLEEAGVVRRERDPSDGRRVIVRLAPGKGEGHEVGAVLASLGKAWEELASSYDDAQLALLLDFLGRGNALSRQELIRLRAAPQAEEGLYSAPLGGVTNGRLVIPAGVYRVILRADGGISELYRARFEGTVPDVKTKDGVVTIRYPKHLWLLGGGPDTAQISLGTAIPWWIVIQGGVSDLTAELSGLALAGLEIKGGMSMTRVELPVPTGPVPVRISGGASEVYVRRPVGVPARVHLKGWASEFVFDERTFSNLGNDVRLQSPDYKATAPGYDFHVHSSASMVTITSG